MQTRPIPRVPLHEMRAEAYEVVGHLCDVFGPTLVSEMAGTKDTKAPIRWSKPGASMRVDTERRLRFALRVLNEISAAPVEINARAWFVSSQPELDESTPIEAIAESRYKDVSKSAQTLINHAQHLARAQTPRGSELNDNLRESSSSQPESDTYVTDSGQGVTGNREAADDELSSVPEIEVSTVVGEVQLQSLDGEPQPANSEERTALALMKSGVSAPLGQTSQSGTFNGTVASSPLTLGAAESFRPSATMKDVAECAGVSIKTVSNVVNGSARVSPETKARVQAAIKHLGYKLNMTARSLRQGKTGMIGLILPELRVPYFAELADSVLKAAEAQGLALLIEQTGALGEHEAEVLRSSRRRFTDGVLFSPVALDPQFHPELEVDFPIVLLGERIFDPRYDHVTMANVEASKHATQHLIAQGCRNIVALGYHEDDMMSSARLRFEGYKQGLESAGIPLRPELLGSAGRWVRETGKVAMNQVLDRGVPFDGVFAMNDALALGALPTLRARGIRVPEDVKVVGFDDTDDAQYAEPPLSSIAPGRDEIAQKAVELLVRRINEEPFVPVKHVASYSLVQRESSSI